MDLRETGIKTEKYKRKELQYLHSTSSTERIAKSRILGWNNHVGCTDTKEKYTKSSEGNWMGRGYFEGQHIYGRNYTKSVVREVR